MNLTLNVLQDKMKGCWTGKNIGGVFGAPFEAVRGVPGVDFYVQDLSQGPPANDDLDLQIIWLAAVERYGRQVNARILAEYWLSYVIPNWVEYGTGKANARAGLIPPLSGDVDNTYKNSNGCWIRSEIWACLAPGHPQIAARYAYEDAICDHAEEGMYAEIFTTVLQCAAFVTDDREKLLEIALSYIPEESALTRAVRAAMDCYQKGLDVMEARRIIHNTAPGTFGVQHVKVHEIPVEHNEGLEVGAPGFDAPENVAFVAAALLYGEGDFEKSLIIANNFGEDTDCTCATLGALLGIMNGDQAIPAKWKDPLDDRIQTMCIDFTSGGIWIPKTATELADRILRNIPGFLGQAFCDIFAEGGMMITCPEADQLYCEKDSDYLPLINGTDKSEKLPVQELCAKGSYVVQYEEPAFTVLVDYDGSAFFTQGEERRIRVTVLNSNSMREQQWVKLSLFLPEGVKAIGSSKVTLPLNNLYRSQALKEFVLDTSAFDESRLEFVIDVALEGRHSDRAIKVVLMAR